MVNNALVVKMGITTVLEDVTKNNSQIRRLLDQRLRTLIPSKEIMRYIAETEH